MKVPPPSPRGGEFRRVPIGALLRRLGDGPLFQDRPRESALTAGQGRVWAEAGARS